MRKGERGEREGRERERERERAGEGGSLSPRGEDRLLRAHTWIKEGFKRAKISHYGRKIKPTTGSIGNFFNALTVTYYVVSQLSSSFSGMIRPCLSVSLPEKGKQRERKE